MRVKVILNPSSDLGHGAGQETAIEAAGQRWGGLEIALTERPKHALLLARTAAEAGYDVVAAAGGDGTVHEVVNGLVESGNEQVRLGVIPLGSGNDFAYALQIAPDVDTAVQRLFNGQPRPVDLARVEDDRGQTAVFANNFGIGFDAQVVIRTEAITRVRGFLMYMTAVLQTMAFYYQTPRLEMQFDDERVSQEVLFLTLGLGSRHGGGFMLTPDGRHDDGLIDSCMVHPIGRLTMLRMLGRAMKGSHVNTPYVVMRQNRRIVVRSAGPMPIHIDGEVFAYPEDNVRQVIATSWPAAIQVVV